MPSRLIRPSYFAFSEQKLTLLFTWDIRLRVHVSVAGENPKSEYVSHCCYPCVNSGTCSKIRDTVDRVRTRWNFAPFFFSIFIFPMGFLPWEIRVAFPGESQLRRSCATQSMMHAGCFYMHNLPNSNMDNRIFNVHKDVNATIAHEGVRTALESLHWKLTLGEKSLAAPGNRTCVGGVPVRCCTNWATSPPHPCWRISMAIKFGIKAGHYQANTPVLSLPFSNVNKLPQNTCSCACTFPFGIITFKMCV